MTDGLRLLADQGLVATIEAGASEIGRVADLARRFPRLRVVLDHFGWPHDLSDAGRRAHLALLQRVADEPNVAARIDLEFRSLLAGRRWCQGWRLGPA